MEITPFRIDVPQADLDDLAHRLEHTRRPDEAPGGRAYRWMPSSMTASNLGAVDPDGAEQQLGSDDAEHGHRRDRQPDRELDCSDRRIPISTMSSYAPRTHACSRKRPSTTNPAFS